MDRGAREDGRGIVDRVSRIGHDHRIAGIDHGEREMAYRLLAPYRHEDLGWFQPGSVTPFRPGPDRLDEERRAAVGRVEMMLRPR